MKDCEFPGCKKKVEDWRWGCSTHWHMLPPNLREKIVAKEPGVAYEVQAWVRSTFGAQNRQEYNPGKWETLVRMVRERDAARARRRKWRAEGILPF